MTTTPEFQKTLHDTTFVEGGEMATLMRSHDFKAGTIASLFLEEPGQNFPTLLS